jgi:HlyD family secretion protein
MKKKKLIWIIAIAAVVLIVLVGGKKAGWFGKNGNFKEVDISKIEFINITETVAATGKIQPEVEVKLSSEVSGEIIELPIIEGQQVKKRRFIGKDKPRFNPSSGDSIPSRVRER